MKLFLDASVLLAAAGSGKGASRFVLMEAATYGWELLSSDYCAEETRRNLPKISGTATAVWKNQLEPRVSFVRASLALDQPLVFLKTKDRPVIITALAVRAKWLLTLDQGDFQTKLGREVYGVKIATPGEFLLEQRTWKP